MTLADVSHVALALAAARAADMGVTIRTLAVDLDTDPLPAGPWDLVVSFNFLWRPLFGWAAVHLVEGGLLVYGQPTLRNLERNDHPSAPYLLGEGELPLLLDPSMKIVCYEEGWFDGRHEARLCAMRTRRDTPSG